MADLGLLLWGEPTTRLINRKCGEPYDVWIGRPSPFGNPFSHRAGTTARYRVATRAEAIARYEEWIRTQPDLITRIKALKGKTLACCCLPEPCHGQVILRIVHE